VTLIGFVLLLSERIIGVNLSITRAFLDLEVKYTHSVHFLRLENGLIIQRVKIVTAKYHIQFSAQLSPMK
jgi:hypothetical protein